MKRTGCLFVSAWLLFAAAGPTRADGRFDLKLALDRQIARLIKADVVGLGIDRVFPGYQAGARLGLLKA